MNSEIDPGMEARVARALYDALRRSCGAKNVSLGEQERFSFDNVLVNVNAGGINLRALARAAIREQRKFSAVMKALKP